MQAVILIGGLGTRLRPLTETIPKGMIKVEGRPFLEYLLLYLKKYDIGDILLCTGYLGEQIEGYFKDGAAWGIKVRYSREEKPLGTGGALKRALPLLKSEFFFLNGDTLLPTDYRRMREAFLAFGGLVFFSAFPVAGSGLAPNLKINCEGRVETFSKSNPGSDFIHVDAGVSLFRKGIADYFPGDDVFSLEEEVYPRLIDAGKLGAWEINRKPYDIGTPEGLNEFEKFLKSRGQAFA